MSDIYIRERIAEAVAAEREQIAARVEAVLSNYGLDDSRFPTIRILAAEIRGALEGAPA